MNKSYDQDGGVFFTCPEKDSTKSCQYYKWDGSMSMFLEAETSANPSENSCFLCKQQGLPTEDSAHKCAICNKPVHAFGCSVEIPGGEEGYGGSDRQCLSCAKGEIFYFAGFIFVGALQYFLLHCKLILGGVGRGKGINSFFFVLFRYYKSSKGFHQSF
ncbi:uncharacterized protein LOC113206231 [Frankliniella occidentalis]|uniref:Uncharacterized protein LOC113206231 n=1 Tax=Frankliniella occidentalis TaxID=133901 RepID=A0A9C6U3E0_FRAOC|nr:uncharacterized protein LOC113206231 [Frankliniella occidentalis]